MNQFAMELFVTLAMQGRQVNHFAMGDISNFTDVGKAREPFCKGMYF